MKKKSSVYFILIIGLIFLLLTPVVSATLFDDIKNFFRDFFTIGKDKEISGDIGELGTSRILEDCDFGSGDIACCKVGSSGEYTGYCQCLLHEADINRDGNVDNADYVIWPKYQNCVVTKENKWCNFADVNRDGIVDQEDYNLLRAHFGETNCMNLDLEISIATLKDSYNLEEKILLTDPPEDNIDNNVKVEVQFKKNILSEEKEKVVNDNNILSDFDEFNQYDNQRIIDEERNYLYINENKTTPEYNGYIIEFEEEPIIVRKNKLDGEAKENERYVESSFVLNPKSVYTRFLKLMPNDVEPQVKSYKEELKDKNKEVKDKILNEVKEKRRSTITGNAISDTKNQELKILNEFDTAFNGIALDITDEEAERIKDIPGVKSVSPNYEVHTTLMDSVPLIGADQVWQLDSDGNNCTVSGKECLTGKGVTIAIIDTGIDYTHPDLGGCTQSQFLSGTCSKVIGGWDFGENDSNPLDNQGHGTRVAGIAAANGSIKGVAPGASLYAYKVTNQYKQIYGDTVEKAIDYTLDPNQDGDYSDMIDVISLSLAVNCNRNYNINCGPDDDLSRTVDNVVDAGVIVVVAAGNYGPSNGTISSPGTARKAITVGISRTNTIPSSSSRGPIEWVDETGKNHIILKPDVVAPSSVNTTKKGGGYERGSGSSSAAPHVTGTVALLKQKNPGWTSDEIIMAIKNTAIDLGDRVENQGYGRVSVINAILQSEEPAIANLETSGNVNRSIDIIGTAQGRSYQNYTLSYGLNENPNIWIDIITSSESKNIGILFRDFDTLKLKDGIYTLRLITRNVNGYESEDRTFIRVDNLEIIKPTFTKIFRAGDNIQIIGRIEQEEYNYTISYGSGRNPSSWSSEGVQLHIYPTHSVDNELIATWNTDTITHPGLYTIKLTLEHNGQSSSKTREVYIDPTLKEGWPQLVDSNTTVDFGGSIIIDIDNDNVKEIITYFNRHRGIKVYNSNGSIKWSLNYTTDNYGDPINLIVDDINNDGFGEIIVGKRGRITSINYNQSILWSSEAWGTKTIISDLDNDGYKEIISSGYKITIHDYKGVMRYIWNTPNSLGKYSFPSVGNFDEDNDFEIVSTVELYEGCGIYIFDKNGSIVNNWTIQKESCTSPVIGDINNDGFSDIVIGSSSSNNNPGGFYRGAIYAFHRNGSYLSGWPAEEGFNFLVPPTIGNVDQDQNLEIAIGKLDSDMYLLDTNGSNISNWPQKIYDDSLPTTFPQSTNPFGSNGAFIADVNNDGFSEIIVTANQFLPGFYDYSGRIFAWHTNGSIVKGFPKAVPNIGASGAIITDLENDGILELVVFNDGKYELGNQLFEAYLYVWDLNTRFNSSSEEWPMFQHDAQRTGCYDCEKINQNTSLTECLDNIDNDNDSLIDYPKDPGCENALDNDEINIISTSRPQSKVVNNENYTVGGLLNLKLQRYARRGWVDEKIVYNGYVGIPANNLIKLDVGRGYGWNNFNVTALNNGTYRAYASFKVDERFPIEDSWNFSAG